LNIEQIFQSLQKGKISPSRAKKLLSLYSIEKIGNIAQIDTGRRNRKGIPEVIFAERKHLLDLKKIIKSKKLELFQESMRSVQGDNPRPWLTLDKAKLSGIFDSVPERDEIEEPVEEQLVVELYSK